MEEAELWSRRVIGAAIAVHRELGPGFLESVYEQALAVEFDAQQIPFVRQPAFSISYRGEPVGQHRLDLLVAGCLVVELKAVDSLAPIHMAHHSLALLINFNVPVLKQGIRRIAL